MDHARRTTRLVLLALALAAAGCELVADFDRSKIPGPETDAGDGSGGAGPGGNGGGLPDGSLPPTPDAGPPVPDAGPPPSDGSIGDASMSDAG